MKFSTEQTASVESEILKRVRARPGISRVALARELKLAASTVGNYVGRLITEGFLAESDKAVRESGRPPTTLRLNPEGGQFIGVDFEARNIMAMAVDFSDTPLKQTHKSIQRSDSVSDIVTKIERAITEVLPDNRGRLLAIGIGAPGLVDPLGGISLQYKYIKGWKNVSLAEPLAKQFGVPVYLENTVRSMALAELWFGQGRGVSDWLCIGIRSGIGAGIVAGGELQRGASYRAGEIGRWRCPTLSHSGAKLFLNGAVDNGFELQEFASVRAVLAALERGRQSKETSLLPSHGELAFSDLIRAARQRDRLTLEVLEVAAEMLGWSVAELSLALNPSKIIMTGPLTLLGDILLQPIRKRAEEILNGSGADVPEIVNSTMGEYSGALGAAALAVHEWKPAR
jgi:N-acetylglucosamine repressor